MFCSRCGTEVDRSAKFCPACGLDLRATTPMAAVRPDGSESQVIGDALKTEYELIQELGRGGMAVVYEAREKLLDRVVAIKVLPMSLAFDADFVERFQREAKTAAKLEHPNIIPIYRVGQAGHVSYFVMKYLRGKSLADLIEDEGALAPADIRRLLIQTAAALGYAHQHDIVHRDIKPDNILFDDSGHAVVTDFGIAKAATGSRLTGTGMSIGTPHYMSPEQARARSIDGRSDIYSLGVVAYQCLTGQVPFDGEDPFAIGYKHVMDAVPTPKLETAEERALFRVIHRMMAKAPKDRFQSAEELIAALEQHPAATVSMEAPTEELTPSTVQAALRSTKGVQPTPTTPIPRIDPRQTPRPRAKKKGSGVLVGLFVLFMMGGGGAGGYWYLLLGSEWPPQLPNGERITLAAVWDVVRGGAAAAQVQPAMALVPDSAPAAVSESLWGFADSLGAGVPEPDTLAADSVSRETSDVVDAAATEAPTERPNSGVLELRGVPGLGRVTVNGEAVSQHMLTVPAGSHRVSVTALGYEDYAATVAVGRGERIIVQVAMRRARGNDRPEVGRAFARTDDSDACALPGPSYNADGGCYDAPPVALQPAVVRLPKNVKVAPPPAILWIRVGAEGDVGRIVPAGKTELRFARQAAQVAKELPFRPAQKNGQPVAAWIRMTFEGEPSP